MSAWGRTAIYVGTACVLVLLAALTAPGTGRSGRWAEEGDLFFPEFTDPGQVRMMRVVSVDEKSITGRVFEVRQQDGIWTIPPHDYPADAKVKDPDDPAKEIDRMANAAGIFIGLRKGAVRSDSRVDHAKLGVVKPMDSGAAIEGRGRSVAFFGENEELLGELVIGKPVEGREGMRYVRVPGSRRTYQAAIKAEFGSRFVDWVETDLLKLDSWSIERLVFDTYSIDEEEGRLRPGEKLTVKKEEGSWTLDGLADDEEVDQSRLSDATWKLDDLRIVGVLPKPEGLSELLVQRSGVRDARLEQSLRRRGFYTDMEGNLRSNEGDLYVHTRDGVVYVLKFGEIVRGSEAGTADAGEGGAEGEPEAGETRSSRYLMVMALFDESALEKPEGEPLPDGEVELRREAVQEIRRLTQKIEGYREENEKFPETLAEILTDEGEEDAGLLEDPWGNAYLLAKGEEGEEGEEGEKGEKGFVIRSLGLDGEEGGEHENADIRSDDLDSEEERLDRNPGFAEYDEKVEKGRAEAENLMLRFAPWFYKIDAASFDKIRLTREELVKKKVDEAEEDDEGEDEEGSDEGEEDEGEEDDGGEEDR